MDKVKVSAVFHEECDSLESNYILRNEVVERNELAERKEGTKFTIHYVSCGKVMPIDELCGVMNEYGEVVVCDKNNYKPEIRTIQLDKCDCCIGEGRYGYFWLERGVDPNELSQDFLDTLTLIEVKQ